jgi:DNA adenine methylase
MSLFDTNGVRADICRPFLRWVGGKQYIVSQLLGLLPDDVHSRRYFEPFVGAGSLFLALGPRKAVLGDANRHLIDTYIQVKRNPAVVHRFLRHLARNLSERRYYSVRDDYNMAVPSARQAARFIFLNRTGFNGVFRVNTSGAYNVPYGHKKRPCFPTLPALRAIAVRLRSAKLFAETFERSTRSAGEGDFVYFDPPYPPLNGTSYFTHYTRQRFGQTDQERVAAVFRAVCERGALAMMTNADTPLIRELYRGYRMHTLDVTRWVTNATSKHKVRELVITSYEPSPEARTCDR